MMQEDSDSMGQSVCGLFVQGTTQLQMVEAMRSAGNPRWDKVAFVRQVLHPQSLGGIKTLRHRILRRFRGR